MRKKLCVFLLLTVGCLLGRPNYVEAEENVQQENVIEPSALQSLPAPEPDPEWKENEQNEQAQSFSQKKIYAEVEERIKQALLTGETQVSVVDLQIPVEANLNSLLFYSPYLSNGIDASFYYSLSECYTRIRLQNTMSLDETKEYFGQVDKKIAEILGLISEDMSNEKKALVIHDYLVYEGEYDYDNLNAGTLPQDSYRSGGLLMKGKGVCQAYAYAYKYLMEQFGIECYVTTSQEMNHAWNIVNIDGSYYHVDCTWDDPVYDRLGRVGHGYFLVSDEAVQEVRGGSKQHEGWDLTELVCDNKKYDDAYWENIQSQIIFSGDSSYYIEGNFLYRRKDNSGETEPLKNLGRWYVWGESGSYWTTAYSGLFMYEDALYYNTATEIRKINRDGDKDVLVYKPDTSEGHVFGTKKVGTEIQYVLKKSPGETGTKYTTLLAGEETKNIFTDVGEEDWFYDEVTYVYNQGIMAGLTEDTFGPNEKVTRAQFVTILYRVEGEPNIEFKELFSDVPDHTWYTSAILWANSNGIVSGYENTRLFGVNDDITREQMATMIYRYALYKGDDISSRNSLEQFSDSNLVSAYALEAMGWAVEVGIISGKEDTILDPLGSATRGECAAIIKRFIER